MDPRIEAGFFNPDFRDLPRAAPILSVADRIAKCGDICFRFALPRGGTVGARHRVDAAVPQCGDDAASP